MFKCKKRMYSDISTYNVTVKWTSLLGSQEMHLFFLVCLPPIYEIKCIHYCLVFLLMFHCQRIFLGYFSMFPGCFLLYILVAKKFVYHLISSFCSFYKVAYKLPLCFQTHAISLYFEMGTLKEGKPIFLFE